MGVVPPSDDGSSVNKGETMNMHDAEWTVTPMGAGTMYMTEGEVFSATVFYNGPDDFAEIIWNNDNSYAETIHSTSVSPWFKGSGVWQVLMTALENLHYAEEEESDEYGDMFDDPADEPEYADDYMRADSDLMYEW